MSPPDIFNFSMVDSILSKFPTKAISGVMSLIGIGRRRLPLPPPPPKIEKVPLHKLVSDTGPWVKIAAVYGAAGLALMAYGGRKTYPKDKDGYLRYVFLTANISHMIHALALFGVPLTRRPKLCGPILIIGTTIFTGVCYYHAFTGKSNYNKYASLGVALMILGWLAMTL